MITKICSQNYRVWKDDKVIAKTRLEEINLERLQNDNEDMFAKLSSLERRQSDSEDSFVKKLI